MKIFRKMTIQFARSGFADEWEIITIGAAMVLFRDEPYKLRIFIPAYNTIEELNYKNVLNLAYLQPPILFVKEIEQNG